MLKKIITMAILGFVCSSANAVVTTGVVAATIAMNHAGQENDESADKFNAMKFNYDHKFHCEPKDVIRFKRFGRMPFTESFAEAKKECQADMANIGITGEFEDAVIRPISHGSYGFGYKFLMRFSIDGFEEMLGKQE